MSCNRGARPGWLLQDGEKKSQGCYLEKVFLREKTFSQIVAVSAISVHQTLTSVKDLFSLRRGRPGAEQRGIAWEGSACGLGCSPRRAGVPAVPALPDGRSRGAGGSEGGFAIGQSAPRGRRPAAAFPAVGGWVAGPAAWLQITGEADPIGAAGVLPFKAGSSVFVAEARMVPGVRKQKRASSALGLSPGGGRGLRSQLGAALQCTGPPVQAAGCLLSARCAGGTFVVVTPCKAHTLGASGTDGSSLPGVPSSPLPTCPWPCRGPSCCPRPGCGAKHGRPETGVSCTRLVSAFAAHTAPKGCFSRVQRALRLSPQDGGFLLTPALAGSPQGCPMHAQPAKALLGCEICCRWN